MADGMGVEAPQAFLISDSAASRIATLLKSESPGSFLRVSVSGGGCSGFQYGFAVEGSTETDDDRFFKHGDATVVVDETSLELLAGSEINYVEDLSGSFFQIRNPNAASSCGCGMSFSIE